MNSTIPPVLDLLRSEAQVATLTFILGSAKYAAEQQVLQSSALSALKTDLRDSMTRHLAAAHSVPESLSAEWVQWLEQGRPGLPAQLPDLGPDLKSPVSEAPREPSPVPAPVQSSPQASAQPAPSRVEETSRPTTPPATPPTTPERAPQTPAQSAAPQAPATWPLSRLSPFEQAMLVAQSPEPPPAPPAPSAPQPSASSSPVSAAARPEPRTEVPRPRTGDQATPSTPVHHRTATVAQESASFLQALRERLEHLQIPNTPEGMNTLCLALHTSGHEHLCGHVRGKRSIEQITNASGVGGGLLALARINGEQAIRDARNALHPHITAGFTPQQITEHLSGTTLTEEHIRNLTNDPPRKIDRISALALTRALSVPPGPVRAEKTALSNSLKRVQLILEAGRSPQDLQRGLPEKDRKAHDILKLLLTGDKAQILTQPPAREDLNRLDRHLSEQFGKELDIASRIERLRAVTSTLLSQKHVSRKALLQHLNILHPNITNAALEPLYSGKLTPGTTAVLGKIEEFMDTLTDADYASMREETYTQMHDMDEQNVVTQAVATRLRNTLGSISTTFDTTIGRMSSVSPLRITAARKEVQGKDALPLTLGQMLSVERQVALLKAERHNREQRRMKLRIPPATGTPESRSAALFMNYREVGPLNGWDVMDILGVDEQIATELLTQHRAVACPKWLGEAEARERAI